MKLRIDFKDGDIVLTEVFECVLYKDEQRIDINYKNNNRNKFHLSLINIITVDNEVIYEEDN